jgi:hypothetical protein
VDIELNVLQLVNRTCIANVRFRELTHCDPVTALGRAEAIARIPLKSSPPRRHRIFDVVRIWRPAGQGIGFRTIRPYVMNAMRKPSTPLKIMGVII